MVSIWITGDSSSPFPFYKAVLSISSLSHFYAALPQRTSGFSLHFIFATTLLCSLSVTSWRSFGKCHGSGVNYMLGFPWVLLCGSIWCKFCSGTLSQAHTGLIWVVNCNYGIQGEGSTSAFPLEFRGGKNWCQAVGSKASAANKWRGRKNLSLFRASR